ncbi:class I SAM-dependent methyltransferase [Desulfonatronovibrio magnus]|uniref:class I SAM-dependent methyltransferase n=1 Tax=Desulfonatronovibrio magnus TaxID=698827 RepID=UPI0005EB1455|nr:methyltransferase domain-containing protein [Desulfonatronovibrio magnus]RQD56924.1 MAG: methyltransferase domain-containing protein [Desulfonatronovibrio sp. MSAO_Bac4]
MFESDKFALQYDHWFETEAGKFAFQQEKRLIQHLVSSWPRRKQSLLDIGCGTGVFLELFYESGFDVYGIDASANMLSRAREKMGNKADLHLGRAQYLPFDDNEFDFSAIITVLEFCEDPKQVLREALRVTKKGMLVCTLNKNSLYYFSKKVLRMGSSSVMAQANWFTFRELKAMLLETVGNKPAFSRSVLPGTKSMWKDKCILNIINETFWPPFAGSFIGTRVELLDNKPLKTPLLALEKQARA